MTVGDGKGSAHEPLLPGGSGTRDPAFEFSLPPPKSREEDDNGRVRRNGTLWTTSAHIITTVIGSGVLSLAWSVAQLGWIAGPIIILIFAFISGWNCLLLADCYRSPDPVLGKRNPTYIEAVRSTLGGMHVWICGLTQHLILVGTCIGYTITASISLAAILRFSCNYQNGSSATCYYSANPYIVAFGVFEIFLSQIPDFHNLWWLSIVASIMSFSYATIGLFLSLMRVIENGSIYGTIGGLVIGLTSAQKVWRVFQALGDIAFAYAYSQVAFEIQDTIESPPLENKMIKKDTIESPPENKTMKKATILASFTTTFFYVTCGCAGYAAFGNSVSGNLLTGNVTDEPYWLLILANACIVIHLVGAYQVLSQPVFATVENWASKTMRGSQFLRTIGDDGGGFGNLWFRILSRTAFVIFTTLISLLLPYFNAILGIVGAIAFWPLSVYFPIEMYIHQVDVKRWSCKWTCLRGLSAFCLIISCVALVGSLVGILEEFASE